MSEERITLSPIHMKHQDFLLNLFNEKEVYHTGFLSFSYPYNEIQVNKMLTNWLNENRKYFIVIVDNIEVGLAQISNLDHTNRVCEVGVLLSSQYQRKGLGQKIFKNLIKICFENLDIYRIEARVKSNNESTKIILERLGFTKEGVMRKAIFSNGDRIDLHIYGLLNDKT